MQKYAMEEIILKMLKNAEIRARPSPYSSPGVLVRKRDGSWRLCVQIVEFHYNQEQISHACNRRFT
jgi:hypothetical protein